MFLQGGLKEQMEYNPLFISHLEGIRDNEEPEESLVIAEIKSGLTFPATTFLNIILSAERGSTRMSQGLRIPPLDEKFDCGVSSEGNSPIPSTRERRST